jgi:hypothetical protein
MLDKPTQRTPTRSGHLAGAALGSCSSARIVAELLDAASCSQVRSSRRTLACMRHGFGQRHDILLCSRQRFRQRWHAGLHNCISLQGAERRTRWRTGRCTFINIHCICSSLAAASAWHWLATRSSSVMTRLGCIERSTSCVKAQVIQTIEIGQHLHDCATRLLSHIVAQAHPLSVCALQADRRKVYLDSG